MPRNKQMRQINKQKEKIYYNGLGKLDHGDEQK